jgi:hypothetical protein
MPFGRCFDRVTFIFEMIDWIRNPNRMSGGVVWGTASRAARMASKSTSYVPSLKMKPGAPACHQGNPEFSSCRCHWAFFRPPLVFSHFHSVFFSVGLTGSEWTGPWRIRRSGLSRR